MLRNPQRRVLRSRAGLANRLRLLLGVLHSRECKGYAEELLMDWPVNQYCNGSFEDIFEPLPNVRFLNGGWEAHLAVALRGRLPYTSETFGHVCEVEGVPHSYPTEWEWYARLKLRPELAKSIEEAASSLGIDECIGIHIRRADLARVPDEAFQAIIQSHLERSADQRFFVATDGAQTQQKLLAEYPDHVVVVNDLRGSTDLRPTTLAGAMLDIHLLSRCQMLYVSVNSSFSSLAVKVHQARGETRWWKTGSLGAWAPEALRATVYDPEI